MSLPRRRLLGLPVALGSGMLMGMTACTPSEPTPGGPTAESPSAPTPPVPDVPADAEEITVEQGTQAPLQDGRLVGLVMVSGRRVSLSLSGGDADWNGTVGVEVDQTVQRGPWSIRCTGAGGASGGLRARALLAVWRTP